MYKHAALSPAIQALQQTPSDDTQKQMFEQQLGQMAYQNFAAKFPDLVESIVTFKTLGSDAEAGTGFGAFILDIAGEPVYVAAVFSDSSLSPIEIMYVKSRDVFVPFTSDWVREISRSASQELGSPSKLPDSVATDVDIRNLVVPPTTGRYSYASVATGAYRELALDSQALGRGIMKRAEESFDPLVWEGFVEQYAKMNGMTPGVSLDSGQTTLMDLAKLFKSHEKTWGTPPVPTTDPSVPQAQPKVAGALQTAAGHVERVGGKALESAAIGGLLGAGTSVYDGSYHDMGDRAMRGAAGGALVGTAGHLLGGAMNKRHPGLKGYGDEIGHLGGTIAGGIGGALQPPQPGYADPYASYGGDVRYASARVEDGGISLVKHAMAPATAREPKLLAYLSAAPNRVKMAFQSVLVDNPALLKFTVESYGLDPLRAALSKHAEAAPQGKVPKGVLVAGDYEATKAFGERAPFAFQGVQRRGYYYEDQRPSKNLAVQVQHFQNAQDALEPGVYNFWEVDGEGLEPALVFNTPVDLTEEDSPYAPKGSDRQVPVLNKVPYRFAVRPGPDEISVHDADRSPELSHAIPRLIVFGNGTVKEWRSNDITGELTTPVALDGTPVYRALFTDTVPTVRAGYGMFAYVMGSTCVATRPLTISDVSKDSRGVITAKMQHSGKTLRIDPHASFARPTRPKGGSFVTVPASWRWVSLSDADAPDVMYAATEVVNAALGKLEERGAKGLRAQDAGGGQISVNGAPGRTKSAALKHIADTYELSGSAAEAVIKLAQLQGECLAWVVPKRAVVEVAKTASVVEQAFGEILQGLGQQMENIQGQMQVLQTVQQRAQELSQSQGADPSAMQQTDPNAPQQGAPAPQAAPQQPPAEAAPQQPPAEAAPAPQGAPQPAVPSMPVEQPQQQEQQAPQQPPAAPPQGDPNAQPPQDPNAPPPAGGAQPPMDPNGMPMEEQAPPPLPVMSTEEPSAQEIAQQINPEFLQQATQLNQQGVFDVSALGEIQRAAQRTGDAESRGLGQGNDKDISATVDDLGRTLLTMQLRQDELRQQLGDTTYQDLEDQVRNTFKGLGKLSLELSQHTAALTHAQDETAT